MIQNIIVGLVFIGAVAYLAKRIGKEFGEQSSGCGKGCGCEAPPKMTNN